MEDDEQFCWCGCSSHWHNFKRVLIQIQKRLWHVEKKAAKD